MEKGKKMDMNGVGYIKRTHKEVVFGGDVAICRTKILGTAGEMAKELISRWGMVSGIEDGEDTAGRAKLRLATVEEVVERACNASEAFCLEAEKRGWFVDIPLPQATKKD